MNKVYQKNMSQYIKTFKQLTYKDVKIAGGKGASLGEMVHNKILVPDGFVVLASAFEKFLEETDLDVEIAAIIKKVKPKDIHSVEEASEIIRDLIADEKFPTDLGKKIVSEYRKLKASLVAVRSSATAEDSSIASWAGELETYLNVTNKNLLESVKKCWSSLFTPRAIFYRFEKKLHDKKVSVAVVVQKMVQSEISGIAFTVHPVTRDKKQMIIEAGWGLGEAIVSGQITPDAYVVDKRDFSIMDINISKQEKMIIRKGVAGTKHSSVPKNMQEKQKLSGKQIIELAKLCLNIERHYQKPQDIEWALAKGKFYITQSRPITTL